MSRTGLHCENGFPDAIVVDDVVVGLESQTRSSGPARGSQQRRAPDLASSDEGAMARVGKIL